MNPIRLARRTNCAHAKQVIPCARLVRIPGLNRAHSIIGVRAVRPPQGTKSVELTNRAHPPIPPRGVCGQLAGTPEPTARTIAVRVQCARFEEVGSEAIRYSREGSLRRRLREQPPTTTDFLSVGRSGLAARRGHTRRLSIPCPTSVQSPSNFGLCGRATTLARVATGPGLATAPTIRNLRHTAQRRPTRAKHAMNTLPEARTGPGFPARRQPA